MEQELELGGKQALEDGRELVHDRREWGERMELELARDMQVLELHMELELVHGRQECEEGCMEQGSMEQGGRGSTASWLSPPH